MTAGERPPSYWNYKVPTRGRCPDGVVCLASRNTGATSKYWRAGDGERIGGTAAADRSR